MNTQRFCALGALLITSLISCSESLLRFMPTPVLRGCQTGGCLNSLMKV